MPYQPTAAALKGRRLVGTRLRELRAERGLTQEGLAHAAGMDRSFVADVERGRHSLMLDRIFDLARALDVPPGALFQVPD